MNDRRPPAPSPSPSAPPRLAAGRGEGRAEGFPGRRVGAALVALLLVLAAGAGCGGAGPETAGDEAGAGGADAQGGDRLPDLELARLAGGAVSLADYRGRVLLLDFWATWCVPCRAQAEILEPLHREYGDRVQFLAVDSGEDEETVRRFVEQDPFPYPVLLDPEDSLGLALDILALPTLVVADEEGRITFFREGIADADELRRELERAGA